MNVTKLELHRSNKEIVYRSRKQALQVIKENGLKPYEYTATDLVEDRIFKGGLWLNKEEYRLMEDGSTIKGVKVFRKYNN